MSQEEKAKAYDEMTRLLSNWYKSETDIGIKDHISAIYPEIAESEDERIRQDIITTLSIGVSCDKSALHPGAHTTLKEAITWLKKQEEKPLKFVGKGDIVAFYEEWEGKKRRGIMLVKSYDYGTSAPRCIWGLHCTGTWYGDWAPSTHEFFKATEEEKQLLIDKMPNDVRARAIELNLIPKTRKEGEQISVDNVEPKFKVGDWI